MARSTVLLDKASRVIPGGVNSPVRAFGSVGREPLFIARGEGSLIYDEDGNDYVDLVSSWGALVLGHANPSVISAVTETARNGTTFGAPTAAEIQLAEMICERMPSVGMVRLCNSGTEATMHAIRLARGFTGRDVVVKMDGCYHGAHDAVLVNAGSGVATLGIPGSPGVPAAVADQTLVIPFNDLERAEDVFREFGHQIACVIVEPVAGNMGCIPPLPGYLSGLKKLTERHGALLIFDEVMTGFRVARGGAQQLYNVMPDLTTMGKVVGGGLPLAAFGGRADVMQYLAPVGPVYQAGTLSGNPLAVAAGIATLSQLDTPFYNKLEAIGKEIEDRVNSESYYQGCSFERVGSMFTLFFREDAPTNYEETRACDTDAFAHYFRAALNAGVYLPPSQFEAVFFSATLEGAILDRAVEGIVAAVSAARS